jgi:hypothetical protein
MMNGVSRAEARELIREDVDRIMRSWARPGTATNVV